MIDFSAEPSVVNNSCTRCDGFEPSQCRQASCEDGFAPYRSYGECDDATCSHGVVDTDALSCSCNEDYEGGGIWSPNLNDGERYSECASVPMWNRFLTWVETLDDVEIVIFLSGCSLSGLIILIYITDFRKDSAYMNAQRRKRQQVVDDDNPSLPKNKLCIFFLIAAAGLACFLFIQSGSEVPSPVHGFEFRGCNGILVDLYDSAISYNVGGDPTCGSEGLTFDGNDYLSVTPYQFGGTVSVEIYVKLTSENGGCIMDFANTDTSNRVSVSNSSMCRVTAVVSQGATTRTISIGSFNPNGWTHIVLTLIGAVMNLYVDGVLVGSGIGLEPFDLIRDRHYIGRDMDGAEHMHGTLAFFRQWTGTALDVSQINLLYAEREDLKRT